MSAMERNTSGAARVQGLLPAGGAAIAVLIMIMIVSLAGRHDPVGAHDAIRGVEGGPIRWAAKNVHIMIHPAGSVYVGDNSDLLAVRLAIGSWNDALGDALTLEEAVAGNLASMNVNDLSTHRVVFDADDETGYFPASTGIVALTPIRFSASNKIVDADIIFNERDHKFSTRFENYTFDIQDIAAHEFGHLLGLDHSPLGAATMYPYVEHQQNLHRSLSEDDAAGARGLYKPGDESRGAIAGTVFHNLGGAAGTPAKGANVVVRHADGRTAAGTISRGNGKFIINGLDPDDYNLTLAPLDGPVMYDGLVSYFKYDLDFGATVVGTGSGAPLPWAVSAGNETQAGAVIANDTAWPVIEGFGPQIPIGLIIGSGAPVSVYGSGYFQNSQLIVSGDVATTSQKFVSPSGTLFQANVSALATAKPGIYDLTIVNPGGVIAVEPGAVDIRIPPPVVTNVSPAQGALSGGEWVTVTGLRFVSKGDPGDFLYKNGSRVIIGDIPATGVNVLSAGTLQFKTPAMEGLVPATAVDIVVINPDGQEARKVKSFEWVAKPLIQQIYPPAVSSMGGSTLHVHGKEFGSGATVEFIKVQPVTSDGATQATVSAAFTTGTRVDAVVPPLDAGSWQVFVHLPGGAVTAVPGTLQIVAKPEPVITECTPSPVPTSGGVNVQMFGSGFEPGVELRIGADPTTGLGGILLDSVVVHASEIQFTNPPLASAGPKTVILQSPTGQVAVASITYGKSASGGGAGVGSGSQGGGGGGGCAGAVWLHGGNGAPPGPGSMLPPMLLIGLAALAWKRRVRNVPCVVYNSDHGRRQLHGHYI